MLSFIVRTALLLATVCSPTYAVLTTCEGDVHRLDCDVGVIRVLTAFYGRSDSVTCVDGISAANLADTSCSLSTVYTLIESRCNGKTFCEFDETIFSDPCVGTFKYTQTTHTCLPASDVVACDCSPVELSCDVGVINVLSGFYGRRDTVTCSRGKSPASLADTTCDTASAFATLSASCDGKKFCQVDNSVFTDPCPGNNAYIETTFTCVPAKHIVICEGTTVDITCATGKVLEIHGAFYGRSDRTTCSFGLAAIAIEDVSCNSISFGSTVASSCNGLNSCSITAENIVTDPCVGTVKFLELGYTCEYQTY